MRVLPKESIPAAFSRSQRAFVEAWYSLTDAKSLDSHRIKTLNARLVLRELVEVCRLVESGAIHFFHRGAVADEAFVILEADPIYQKNFASDWRILRATLKAQECRIKDAPRGAELRVLAEDALRHADEHYQATLVREIELAIAADASVSTIYGLVSPLLSDLVDIGFDITGLHGFHKFFIMLDPDRDSDAETANLRSFDDRFQHLVSWIRRSREEYEVVLRISRAEKLLGLRHFCGWQFGSTEEQSREGGQWGRTSLGLGNKLYLLRR